MFTASLSVTSVAVGPRSKFPCTVGVTEHLFHLAWKLENSVTHDRQPLCPKHVFAFSAIIFICSYLPCCGKCPHKRQLHSIAFAGMHSSVSGSSRFCRNYISIVSFVSVTSVLRKGNTIIIGVFCKCDCHVERTHDTTGWC